MTARWVTSRTTRNFYASWLRELKSITGRGKFLFPSLHTALRPISENTVNVALRRLGYSRDEMTGHGFRAMASTLLNEQGWTPDVIELQLAHAERNKVRAAYNRAQRLPERRKMMQSWADYLDALASSKDNEFRLPDNGRTPTAANEDCDRGVVAAEPSARVLVSTSRPLNHQDDLEAVQSTLSRR